MLQVMHSRAIELKGALKESEKAFLKVYRKTYWKLYPLGIVSRLYRAFRKKFLGRPYLSTKEYEMLRGVIIIAQQFARIIDQPMMDAAGNPVEKDVQRLQTN